MEKGRIKPNPGIHPGESQWVSVHFRNRVDKLYH
jgi:hypothetical protein